MKKNNRGFTLAELLIVVAIIAVLVAIAIPVFTQQLEKAREATDASNIRAKYAEVMVEVLSNDKTPITSGYEVVLKQTVAKWQNTVDKESLSELLVAADTSDLSKTAVVLTGDDWDAVDNGKKVTITYAPATSSTNPTVTFAIG